MADTQSTTHQDGAIAVVPDGPQIVGFSARHTAGQDYQSAAVEIEYRFPQPVDYVDAVRFFGDAQAQAEEQAEAKLADTIARRKAQAAAVQPANIVSSPATSTTVPASQPPVPAQPGPVGPASGSGVPPIPASLVESQLGGQQVSAAQPGGLPVAVGTTPKGGQVKYVPTSHLSSKAFEDAIRAQITALGFDESEFAVFDNRSRDGQYPGFEQGGQNYAVASIKARNDSRAQKVLDKKTAFYADFDDAGQLTVKASKDAEAYRATLAALAA